MGSCIHVDAEVHTLVSRGAFPTNWFFGTWGPCSFFFFSFFWISFGTIARRDRYSFSCAFVTPSMCMNIALSLCFALYVLRAFYALSLFGYCVTASQRATSFVLPHSDIGPKRPCRVLVSAMLLPAIFTHVHKLGSIRLVHRNATIHVPRCLVNMTCMHECLDN